jgi:hypothetical protein
MTRLTPVYKAALSAVALLAGTVFATARASAQITPPVGNAAFLSLFGSGAQIYDSAPDPNKAGAFLWKLTAPSADLFTDASETTHFGTHFAGPTWQADADGSAVVGMLSASHPSPHPDSIPELLLSAKSHSGVGIFDAVTFIQRLDTIGGLAPAAAPTGDGQEFRSPYTATYRFYRAVPERGMTALFAGMTVSGLVLLMCRRAARR